MESLKEHLNDMKTLKKMVKCLYRLEVENPANAAALAGTKFSKKTAGKRFWEELDKTLKPSKEQMEELKRSLERWRTYMHKKARERARDSLLEADDSSPSEKLFRAQMAAKKLKCEIRRDEEMIRGKKLVLKQSIELIETLTREVTAAGDEHSNDRGWDGSDESFDSSLSDHIENFNLSLLDQDESVLSAENAAGLCPNGSMDKSLPPEDNTEANNRCMSLPLADATGAFTNMAPPQMHIKPQSNGLSCDLLDFKGNSLIGTVIVPGNQSLAASVVTIDRPIRDNLNDWLDDQSLAANAVASNSNHPMYNTISNLDGKQRSLLSIVARDDLIEDYPEGTGTRVEVPDGNDSNCGGYVKIKWDSLQNMSTIDDFEKLIPLGEGSFGCVFRTRKKGTQQTIALKRISFDMLQDDSSEINLSREIRIQSVLEHPNIARLHYSFFDFSSGHVCLVTDYCAGRTLFDAIFCNEAKFQELQVAHVIVQVSSALHFCHVEKKIVHRDIKAENIMLNVMGEIKLIDFGFATHKPLDGQFLCTILGTPEYSSPELAKEDVYDETVDVWAVGIVMYLMLSKNLPFRGATEDEEVRTAETLTYIREWKETKGIPFCNYDFSPGAKKMISQFLRYNPKQRIKLDEVERDSWIQQLLAAERRNDMCMTKKMWEE